MLTFIAVNVEAVTMCDVRICNKLERFTINPFSLLKDKMGETCWNTTMPKSEARVGKRLSSESRWYQGSSLNPTKRSVTKIKAVHNCYELK